MSFPLGKCSSSRSKGPAGFTASGLCQWTDRKGLPSQKKTSKILGGGGWVGLETFVAGGENLGGGPLGVGKTPEQRRELVTLPGTVLGGWKASHTPPPGQDGTPLWAGSSGCCLLSQGCQKPFCWYRHQHGAWQGVLGVGVLG